MTGLFGGAPKAPKVEAPAIMPEEDTAAIEAAKKKKTAQIKSRSGRSSTILTDVTDKLGG